MAVGVPVLVYFLFGVPELALPSQWADVEAGIADGSLPAGYIVNVIAGLFLLAWIGGLALLAVMLIRRDPAGSNTEAAKAGSAGFEPVRTADTPGFEPVPTAGTPGFEPVPAVGTPGFEPVPTAGTPGFEPAMTADTSAFEPVPTAGTPGFEPAMTADTSAFEPVPTAGTPGFEPAMTADTSAFELVGTAGPESGSGSQHDAPAEAESDEPWYRQVPPIFDEPFTDDYPRVVVPPDDVAPHESPSDPVWPSGAIAAEAGFPPEMPPPHPIADAGITDAEIVREPAAASSDEPPMIVPVRAYYFTRAEDTLRSIAAQFLQTPKRWEELRSLNAASPGVAGMGPDTLLPVGTALALPGEPLPWGKPDPVYLWTLAEKFLFTAWGREPTPEEVAPFWRGLTSGRQLGSGTPSAPPQHLAAPPAEVPAAATGPAPEHAAPADIADRQDSPESTIHAPPATDPSTAQDDVQPPAPPAQHAPAPPTHEPAPGYEPPAPSYESPVPPSHEPVTASDFPALPTHEPPAPSYESPVPPSHEPVTASDFPALPTHEPPPGHEPPSGYEPPAPSYESPVPPSHEPVTASDFPALPTHEPPPGHEPPSGYEPPAPSYESPVPPSHEPVTASDFPALPTHEPPPGHEPPSGYEPPAPSYESPVPPSHEPVTASDFPALPTHEPRPGHDLQPPAPATGPHSYDSPVPPSHEPPTPAFEPPAPPAHELPQPTAPRPPGDVDLGPVEPETAYAEAEAPRMPSFMPSLTGADTAAAPEAEVVTAANRSLAGTAIGDAMMLWQLSRTRRRGSRRDELDPLEESLKQNARIDSLNLIEAAMRHLRAVTVGQLREKPAVLAVRVGTYGFEVLLNRPVQVPDDWQAASGGYVLELPQGVIADDLYAAGQGPTLCPALVPVGDTVEGPLLLN